MIDTFHLSNSDLNNQVFYTNGGSNSWQIWQKPSNAKMVSFLVIGGGGGGGSGQSGTGSTTRRSGGGGGSSSVTLGMFSASQIPDTLFIQVGPGGIPGSGTTGSNGGSGGLSYVSVQPNTTAINILLQSGAAAAGGGNSGTNAGTAGSAGTSWAGSVLSDLGLVTSIGGQSGGAGTTTTAPTNISIAGITTGGAAGGGTNLGSVFNGADINGSGFCPTISGGTGNVNLNGTDGSGGFISLNPSINGITSLPLFFTGGAGGGASNNNTGGSGGAGGYGSGGGGGGVGVTNNSGPGGRGGDGIVIVTCY
jgi:hypothetical protein